MRPEDPVLAIDVGGTKIAVGVVEPGGRLASWAQTETPRGLEAEQLWRTLDVLCTNLLAEQRIDPHGGLAGVGCGCGGPLDWPVGRVSPLNIPAWRSFPLRERLHERFGGIPVRLHNDAICMAVGEHWRGAGRGRRNLLGMVVSTGVGGGLVLDGRLINGATGNAGHIGHVVVDPAGPFCTCGGRGCLEAIARGPALAAWAQGEGWRPGQTEVTAKDLADDAAQGHPIGVGRLASPSPPRSSCATWRWSRSAAGSPRPGRCCSSRWKRRCAPTRGLTTPGTCPWWPPRWARARG